jgi:hypothetical protein
MAPEWSFLVDRSLVKNLSTESVRTFERLLKLDIYALGIILSDLICNPVTQMETMKIDECLRSPQPKLPKGYKLETLIEAELML